MLTVFLITALVLIVILAPFAPQWVTTTKSSFEAMAQVKEINDASRSSITVIVPSQISPWLSQQANTMINAEGPLDWHVVSFRTGPCNSDNLAQLPSGKYSTSIAQTCESLDDIQQRYSGTCFLASGCNVPDIAKEEIADAMDIVWDAFSDAGFVLPYDLIEQQVGP
jgi:hypothetical protein